MGKIKSGETFIHLPSGKTYECVGIDDNKIWYVPKGEKESMWFDPDDCELFTENDFWVQCQSCKQYLKNWSGSTPCCGSVAYVVDNYKV